jgi:hypothetical protein
MASSAQTLLDEILDGRAKLRQQRIAVDSARITLNQAKIALKETKEHWEDLLTEVEQRQGRLAFDDAEAQPAQAQAPQARRGRPRKERDAEGPRA